MQYQIKENCLTIFLPAEVDHHNAEEIKREADKVIEEQHIKYVIFDFGRTNFMDSSGIGVIMGRYRHIFLLGGEVWAIHTSERMRQILNMSGVTKVANAENNHNLDRKDLYVLEAYANDAPVMKRWRPKAKGSAYPILKRSSHIGVTVAER